MENKTFLEIMSSKNVNFLIGAGVSSGILPTLKFGDSTLENIIEELSKEKADHASLMKWYFYSQSVAKGWINTASGNSEFNETMKSYEEFVNNIINFLERENLERPKRCNIFTTNYDLCFERTFDKINKENKNVHFNDGTTGFIERTLSVSNFFRNVTHSGVNDKYKYEIPTINLIKMHGSVNYICEEKDQIKVKYSESDGEILKLSKEIHETEINNNTIGNIVYDISKKNNLDEILNEIEEIKIDDDLRNEINIFSAENDKLFIVNPTKKKFSQTVFEQHHYQTLRMLSQELEKENSILIVLGFSFDDEHIREIVIRSMTNPSLKVYVIPYNESVKEDIKEKFKGFIANKRLEFVVDNPLEKRKKFKGDLKFLNYLTTKNNKDNENENE